MLLVSKLYIFDLVLGQSFVEFFVKQGYDVYMIDWGVLCEVDKGFKFEDYVFDFIFDCIDCIFEYFGEEELFFVGYCMGGFFFVFYCVFYEEFLVCNFVCFMMLIDYDGMEFFKKWIVLEYFDVDCIVDMFGNVLLLIMYVFFSLLCLVLNIVG